MKTIYEKLNSGGKLMLIYAEGGIGKTTLAAKYWNEALNNYKYAAWLFCESGIVNSLKELALQLNIDLNGMDEQQQIQAMKRGLAAVQNDFLLVLDNANNEDDIRLFRQEFEGFHWHVLITSRCQGVLDKAYELPITHLPPPLAKALFTRHYREEREEFEELLDRVLLAINYHTLLTEVFAKNLAEAAELKAMDLTVFLNKLENEGLYLREHSFEVENIEWATKRKVATIDQILDTLYDFSQLTEEQRFLMVNLSLLPAESYTLAFINSLLEKEWKRAAQDFLSMLKQYINRLMVRPPDQTIQKVRNTLKGLVRKGWISETNHSYRLSPITQKLALEKHTKTLGKDCQNLLSRLIYITESNGFNFVNTSLEDLAPYIHPVHHMSQCLKSHPIDEIAHYNLNASVYYISIGDLINAKKTYINYGAIYKTLLLKKNEVENKRGLANSYVGLGNIYLAIGNWENALSNYQEGFKLAKEVYKYNPKNPSYKHDLAIFYQKLGEVYMHTERWEDALNNYQECFRLNKEVYENYPNNLIYKNSLAISYERLGSICEDTGDWKNTLINYQETHKLIREVYESKPENLEYKHNLAISYEKLRRGYESIGDWENALVNCQEYHRLSKEVHNHDPKNLVYKSGWAHSYSVLGRFYYSIEDWESAIANDQEYNRLSKEVYMCSTENLEYKNNLAISYHNLGTTYQATGDWENALASYKERNRLSEEIFNCNPKNLEYKNSLAISYEKLGTVYEETGDIKNALANYQKYYQFSKEIHNNYPHNLKYKNNLAISYDKLGRIYEEMEDWENAQANYQENFILSKEIYENNLGNLEYKDGLAISYERMGNFYEARGDLKCALSNYQERNRLSKEVNEYYPDSLVYKNSLAISYSKLGNIWKAMGDWENALVNYQKMLTIFREISKSSPGNISYKNGLAQSYYHLGSLYIEKDKEFAKENINQSLVLYKQLLEKAPEITQFGNNYNYIKNYLKELKT